MDVQHQQQADVFFRMIKDHGRFNERQLYRFVEMQTGQALHLSEQKDLLSYAKELGAKREKGLAEVYLLPPKMRLVRRRVRNNDQQLDMFRSAPPAPSTAKRRRTA